MAKEVFDHGEYVKQQMIRHMSQIKYCAFCGKPVLPFATDEKGYANRNVEWELQHSAHWDCYTKAMRRKQNGSNL